MAIKEERKEWGGGPGGGMGWEDEEENEEDKFQFKKFIGLLAKNKKTHERGQEGG